VVPALTGRAAFKSRPTAPWRSTPHAPVSLPHPLAAATARAPLTATARRAVEPELALPATVARRRPLHRAMSTASPYRTRCSHRYSVVSPHADAMARRSSAIAHRSALLRGSRPTALPLSFLSHAPAPHHLTGTCEPFPTP
jgi:hypothetical protein